MTEQEKIDFINSLLNTVGADIIADIKNGKIPAEWDGIELRQLIADNTSMVPYKMDRARKQAYNNTVIVNNL